MQLYHDLAAHDPGAYRPDVAMTLNNFGVLYRDTRRRADADKAYGKALTIFRDLAAHDPGAYRPDVAGTLNNLGKLYRNTGRFADADKALSEALTIYRDLVPSNPEYASRVAALTKLLADPEIKADPSENRNPSLLYFLVTNASNKFDMYDVTLSCRLLNAVVLPSHSYLHNDTITVLGHLDVLAAGRYAEYRCPLNDAFSGNLFAYAVVQIAVDFKTIGLGHSAVSDIFTWTRTSPRWREGVFAD